MIKQYKNLMKTINNTTDSKVLQVVIKIMAIGLAAYAFIGILKTFYYLFTI